MQIHAEYWVSHSTETANSATNEDEIIGGKFWTVPLAFTSRYSTSQDRYWAYCRDSITNAASTTEQQLWRQTEQALKSIKKNNQNNVGHMRLESGLRECLRRVFLFRKWTPQCVTFPTNLLSHTQVLKWCNSSQLITYSHSDSSTGTILRKVSKQSPSPKDVTGMLPALPRVRYAKKQHRELGWLQGREAAKKGNGRARQCRRKKGCPGKQTVFCYFYYSLHFPSSTSCHQSTFLQSVICTRLVTAHLVSKEYAIQQRGGSIKHNPFWPCVSSSSSVFCDHTF